VSDNVLITADLHIKQYAHYNREPNSRLNQFIDLARMMRQSCEEHNVDTVIIAGDLLDAYCPPPIVYQTLHEFLSILSKEVGHIYIISGNHDAPKSGYDARNIYYPILAKTSNSIIEVLHDEYRVIGGKQFYFRGWEPELRPFPKADVIITHAYINGASLPNGLKINGDNNVEGSYTLAFAGDIHKHQVIKNSNGSQVICVGCPIQNSFADDPCTGYIVLEPETMSWRQISTAEDSRFLRFRYDDNDGDIQMEIRAVTEHDLQSETDPRSDVDKLFENYNIVYKQREVKDAAKPFEIKNIGALNINDILNELIKDFQYKNELLGVIGRNNRSLESFIQQELKVTLKDIEITDFKSIAYFKLDFTTLNKLTLITGQNGAGKSTFLQALVWAMTGESPSEVDDVIQSGKTYCEVKLNVEYQNNNIYIERSRGSKFEFKARVDSPSMTGQWIAASSKADLQKRLEEVLPIIKKLHLLYLNQSRDGFLSELNDAARVSLMSELSGQSIVADMTRNVEEHVAGLKTVSDKSEAKYNENANKLAALKSQFDGTLTDPSDEIALLNTCINDIGSDKLNLTNSKLKTAEAIRQGFEAKETAVRDAVKSVESKQNLLFIELNEINKDITAYENIKNKKLTWVCHVCKSVIKATDITEADIEDAKAKLSELFAKREEISKRKAEYEIQISNAHAKLNSARAELSAKIAEAVKPVDVELAKKSAEEAQARSRLNGLMEQMGRFKKNREIKKATEALEATLADDGIVRDSDKQHYAEFKKMANSVFGDDGLLSAAILEKIATAINNDPEVKILTTKRLKNGKLKPTLDLELKVNGVFEPYARLSGGEKLRTDVWFLNRMVALVSGISFMALDETLKYADAVNAEKMFQNLIDADIRNIFLTYHGVIPPMVAEHSDVSFMQVTKDGGDSVYTIA